MEWKGGIFGCGKAVPRIENSDKGPELILISTPRPCSFTWAVWICSSEFTGEDLSSHMREA